MRKALSRATVAGRRRVFRMTSRTSARHALVGPPKLWEVKRRFQFEFLTSSGLRPEHRLLDIGCGALRGGIPLIHYLETGHYTGIEARENVLEEGRKELAEAGLENKSPTLIHTDDPAQVHLEARVQIAWAFSVLIHMPDEVVDSCFGLVDRELTSDGRFYANVMLGARAEGRWQEFPVLSRPRDLYESMAARHGLAMSDLGALNTLGWPGESQGGNGTMLCFSRAGASLKTGN